MALPVEDHDRLGAWLGLAPNQTPGEPRILFVMKGSPWNIGTGATEAKYAIDGWHPHFASVAELEVEPRLSVPSLRHSLEQDGAIAAGSLLVGELLLENSDGGIDDWFDPAVYSWEGRVVELGFISLADNVDDFRVLQRFTVASIRYSPAGVVITPQDPLTDFEEVLERPRFGGWGASLNGNGSSAYAEVGDDFDPGLGPWMIGIRFSSATVSSNEVLAAKKPALVGTAAGWAFYFSAAGELLFSLADGATNWIHAVGSAHDYDDGTERLVTLKIDPATSRILSYVDGVAVGTATSISGYGAITTSSVCRFLRESAGSSYSSAKVSEIRFWSKALGPETIEDQAIQTISDDERYLEALYRCNEYGGTTLFDHRTGPKLVSYYHGATAYAQFGDVLDQGTGSFVLGFWYRSRGTGGRVAIVTKKAAAAGVNAGLSIQLESDGTLRVFLSHGVANFSVQDTVASDDGRWHFALLDVDRILDVATLYRGDFEEPLVEVASTDISTLGNLNNADQLVVGAYGGLTNVWEGWLCWGFLAGQRLSGIGEAKVKRWARGDLTGLEPDVEWFVPMDDGSGTTITDLGPSGLNGTITAGLAGAWFTRDATLTSPTWEDTFTGDPELAGVLQADTYGSIYGVAPMLVSAFNLHYRARHDEIARVRTVYAGGSILTEGALDDYTVDLVRGLITLNATHQLPITMDLDGAVDATEGFLVTVPEMVEHVLKNYAGLTSSDLNIGTFQTFEDHYPYRVGLYLGAEEWTVREVLQALLGPRGFWSVDRNGKFRLGIFRDVSAETPDWTLTAKDVKGWERSRAGGLTWERYIGFAQIVNPITEFAAGVSAAEQRRQSTPMQFAHRRDKAARDKHAGAISARLPTAIFDPAGAKEEADVELALYSAPRSIYEITLASHPFEINVGEVVRWTDRQPASSGLGYTPARYDLDEKQTICIGTFDDPQNHAFGLTLWG